MKEALKNDRARIQVGRISSFGLMEMSRQRLRTGVLEASTKPCPHCEGTGLMRTAASAGLSALRILEDEAARGRGERICLRAGREAAVYVLNKKRAELADIEQRYGVMIESLIDESFEGARMSVDSSGARPVARRGPKPAPIEEDDDDEEDRRSRIEDESRRGRGRRRAREGEARASARAAVAGAAAAVADAAAIVAKAATASAAKRRAARCRGRGRASREAAEALRGRRAQARRRRRGGGGRRSGEGARCRRSSPTARRWSSGRSTKSRRSPRPSQPKSRSPQPKRSRRKKAAPSGSRRSPSRCARARAGRGPAGRDRRSGRCAPAESQARKRRSKAEGARSGSAARRTRAGPVPVPPANNDTADEDDGEPRAAAGGSGPSANAAHGAAFHRAFSARNAKRARDELAGRPLHAPADAGADAGHVGLASRLSRRGRTTPARRCFATPRQSCCSRTSSRPLIMAAGLDPNSVRSSCSTIPRSTPSSDRPDRLYPVRACSRPPTM